MMKGNRSVDKLDIIEIATDVLNKYDIYVVNGKTVAIREHCLDLNDLDDMAAFLEYAEELFVVDDLRAVYGTDTVGVLCPYEDDKCVVSVGHLDGLPEDVQKKCRLAILKQKNQIVDIDGYIHVVNGKVICFKPDVYDLHNPNDVADLVLTSFEIGVDDKFPLVHGNDTILFLDKSPTVANELIVSMGDLRGFPKECQRKVDNILNGIE